MKVVITRKMPDLIVNMLEKHCDIYMWQDANEPIPHHILLKEIADAEAVFTNVTDRIDKEVFTSAPRLRVISTMAVGFNNIDVAEATRRGIQVGHTPDVLTEAVADLTFALILATARRVVEGMAFIKEDKWEAWGPMLLTGQHVYGATIGIIGMGRIGEGVARRAHGFGMNILYHNRGRREQVEHTLGAAYTSLDELLRQSDYVVMLAPSTKETTHMISTREFSLMRPNAIFINTSRGTNVDEKALYEALKERKIWGAGLDVFEVEPISSNHPLFSLENVVLLPHIGSATVETRLKMAEIAARNILAGLKGESLLHIVNPEVYDTGRELKL